MNNEIIPIDSNHPDATLPKREEPDNFFSDKAVPIFGFGDYLKIKSRNVTGTVIGLAWRKDSWEYFIDYSGEGYGHWVSEQNLTLVNNEEGDRSKSTF